MRIEVERRDANDYPKRDLTPEHTKRSTGADAPLSKEVLASYAYVDAVSDTADLKIEGAPAWHGWALREAFLAGVSHEKNKPGSLAPTWLRWLACVFLRGGHTFGRWWWPDRPEATGRHCAHCADMQTYKNRRSWFHRERVTN